MSPTILKDWAPIIVSIAALVVAGLAEVRNERRFELQLTQADAIAKAQVRPFLGVYSLKYLEQRGVVLYNRGAGPAVITEVRISRDGKLEQSFPSSFDLGPTVVWKDFFTFGERTVLKAGDEVSLVLLSKEVLVANGLRPAQADRVLGEFEKQKSGLSIQIQHEDVLGNKLPPMEMRW